MTEKLISDYRSRETVIKRRLKDFKSVWRGDNKRIFSELCFCVCTPQSKAVYCDKAVSALEESGVLFSGSLSQIRKGLKAVRFPNNKARYILENRRLFTENGSIRLKQRINENDIPGTRDWLVKNVKGLGFKEASHFLRNVGFGRELAILDVHILKNMVRYGIIDEVPKTISRKLYMLLEDKLKDFSRKVDIPMDELDLLLWSQETGEVFK